MVPDSDRPATAYSLPVHARAEKVSSEPVFLRTVGGQRRPAEPGAEPEDATEERRALRCRDCGATIADERDAIAVGTHGVVATHVNPAGYAHEVLTVRRARGLLHVGPATAEATWFPGWAWTVASCATCGLHLGWRFDATSPDLAPPRFWALRRAALVG
jgi:cereblon